MTIRYELDTEQVKKYLRYKGVSIRQATKDMGLTSNTLYKLVRGETQPQLDTFMRPAAYLDADAFFLVKRVHANY